MMPSYRIEAVYAVDALATGSHPPEWVQHYFANALPELQRLAALDALTQEDQSFLSNLGEVVAALCGALDGGDTSTMKMEIKRRRAGKPHDQRKMQAMEAAAIYVEHQEMNGEKKEAAIQFATEHYGVSRSELFKELAIRKVQSDNSD